MLFLEVIWEWNISFLRLILHGTKKEVHHEDSDFCCEIFLFFRNRLYYSEEWYRQKESTDFLYCKIYFDFP